MTGYLYVIARFLIICIRLTCAAESKTLPLLKSGPVISMNPIYFMLGKKAAQPEDGTAPSVFIAYGDNEDGGIGLLSWSPTSPQRNTPLAHLVDQARQGLWLIQGKLALKRYDAVSSRGYWLERGPQWIAQADLQQSGWPDPATNEGRADAPILRDLQRIARQIVGRKAAFVFPAKWPNGLTAPDAELVRAMVQEICAHFRYASVEEELPWTFLSMAADPDGLDPLGDFIRSLHNEMLVDTSDVKVADWRRKGGTILLSGPTGSGKSYAARLLAADPKYGSLVEVNLAGVLEEQLESRMRGYEPGTFTGADRNGRKGWFEEANGGVLFLDEFQSVSPAAQVQLLDVLSAVSDDIQIARTGADHRRRRYKVKVILALNEDIDTLLQENRLRRDLYYRVRFIQTFPSLKERLNPERDRDHRYLRGMLASYRWKSLRTIKELCQLDAGLRGIARSLFPEWKQEALSALAQQEWEGNFRELERVAYDVFYAYDYHQGDYYPHLSESDDAGQPQQIGRIHVENILRSWFVPASGNRLPSVGDGMAARKQEMLEGIQDALRDCGFIIERALKIQPYFRSRPTLRKYLRDHVGQLATDIRNDSRIVRFLALEKVAR
jgi:hypothetical protein